MPLKPEDPLEEAKKKLIADANKTRHLAEQGADAQTIMKVLKALAPVFGYQKHDVRSLFKRADPMADARLDSAIGPRLPPGFMIGGRKGITYGDLLHKGFRNLPWWKYFRKLMDLHGEVIWVISVKGAGYWVIHNLEVSPWMQRPAIIIPAKKAGLNHVRVMRLELFIEEHTYE
jgi:hypothetical protein